MCNTPPPHRLCGTAPETKMVTRRSPQALIELYIGNIYILLVIDNADIFIVENSSPPLVIYILATLFIDDN